MKKLLLLFVSLSVLTFTSCSEEENPLSSTTVKVKVVESGEPKSGVTVYFFDATYPPESKFFKPFFAEKKVKTDSKGFATFKLEELEEIEVLDTKNTFYFGVFNNENVEGKETIAGKETVIIKKGETKNITLFVY